MAVIRNRPPIKYLAVVEAAGHQARAIEFLTTPNSEENVLSDVQSLLREGITIKNICVAETDLEF
ncbi:hypothetical protein [Crocosphaera chwakensis]|uniref:Uncharacterized protein n=1 Tax=Crocosphaera chwakensis CCY0110 TaxID=391612 RepID=A3IWI3_9CHRO|nr:hypothetical protein [Crocosphaera chwakensis]EAZ89167.1 hypothetical protein CY0110_31735 [Crocosphaera chwakensis CCY0110]